MLEYFASRFVFRNNRYLFRGNRQRLYNADFKIQINLNHKTLCSRKLFSKLGCKIIIVDSFYNNYIKRIMNSDSYALSTINSPSPVISPNKHNINLAARHLIAMADVLLDRIPHNSDQLYRPKFSENLSLKYYQDSRKQLLIVPPNKTQLQKQQPYNQKVFVLHKRDYQNSERNMVFIQKNNMNYIRKAIDHKRKILNRLERKSREDKHSVPEYIQRLATVLTHQQKQYSLTQSLVKNSRIAREIKAIKIKMQESMRQSSEVCRSFQIKSIEPTSQSTPVQKRQSKAQSQKRNKTQPNSCPKTIRSRNPKHSLSFIIQNTPKIRMMRKQRQKSINSNDEKIRLYRMHPFKIPFETYYYRDFLWKVNYTNQIFIEPPLEYEHRLKVYVGKGNNSSMVRGLINRRYWFALTDRLQQANYVWTQLKLFAYFDLQKTAQFSAENICQTHQYQTKNLMLLTDTTKYRNYSQLSSRIEQRGDERFITRQKAFRYRTILRNDCIKLGKMQNHLQHNYVIGNKKALFSTMSQYYRIQGQDPFKVLPLTFHVKMGIEDPTFLQFQKYYHSRSKQIRKKGEQKQHRNIWIVKPGQNSNRGTGIHLCLTLQQIKTIIKPRQRWPDGSEKTFIVQSYIERPLLYHKRKFDLRHYILITRVNGCLKGYWYHDGYVRTTSSEYKLSSAAGAIHLTNDAIQKGLAGYGKYEKGNKLSYEELQNHISRIYKGRGFYQDVYPFMKKIATDVIKASAGTIDPLRLQNNFELFGLDFMIDDELRVWLIEVNSNPCLELSCPLLAKLIPNLIENVLQLTMDAMYPPPIRYSPKMPRYLSDMTEANKFELVFDERIQKLTVSNLRVDQRLIQQEEDIFQDDGTQWEEQKQ